MPDTSASIARAAKTIVSSAAFDMRARLILLALVVLAPVLFGAVHAVRAGHRMLIEQALLHDAMTRPGATVMLRGPDGAARAFALAPITDGRPTALPDDPAIARAVDRTSALAYAEPVMLGVLALALAWYAAERLILRPIRLLADAATAIGQGYSATPMLAGRWASEFVPLADALTDMLRRLGEREEALRAANQELYVLASLDSLSGLANRRVFDTRLANEWQNAREFRHSIALLMVDVDHFKAFNDTYGHLEGDRCLRRLSTVLSEAAEACGALAARYGGEEFALLLVGEDAAAIACAERVRQAVVDCHIAHKSAASGQLTVSIGVAALVPGDDATPQTLIAAADAGLYRAKASGRNRIGVDGPPLSARLG